MAVFDDALSSLPADRRELVELWLARTDASEPVPYVEPRTPQERTIADIWAETLDVERVGVDDDYFALGGDSIVAIMVIAKAQQAGIGLSTNDLFEAPTIRRLVLRIGDPDAAAAPAAEPARTAGHALTPLQSGMLFHTLQDPAAYLVQLSCRIEGHVDVPDLRRAWQLVADRNWALRLSFRWSDGEPRQVVHRRVTVPVEVVDLTGADPADQRTAIARHLADDLRRGVRLDEPPLLRVTLSRLGDTTWHCVITHHHLLLDGWSQQLLLAELMAVYDGLADGQVPPAPERLPIGTYLDWLAGRDLAAAERYWRRRLTGFHPVPLGTDDTTPADGYAEVNRRLTDGAGRALAEFARGHGLTVGTLVQGGWALLLRHLTGTDDVAFGVTVSGRPPELAGITDAIGMFINTLPMRVVVVGVDEPVRWLAGLQRELAELQRFSYTPLTLVDRCHSGHRLFDSLVVIENFPTHLDEGYAGRSLRVTEATASVVEGYPLVLEVRPGPPMRLRLRHDTATVPAWTATGLLAGLAAYVDGLLAAPQVADLAALVDAELAGAAAAAGRRRRAVESGRLRSARRQPVSGVGDD